MGGDFTRNPEGPANAAARRFSRLRIRGRIGLGVFSGGDCGGVYRGGSQMPGGGLAVARLIPRISLQPGYFRRPGMLAGGGGMRRCRLLMQKGVLRCVASLSATAARSLAWNAPSCEVFTGALLFLRAAADASRAASLHAKRIRLVVRDKRITVAPNVLD